MGLVETFLGQVSLRSTLIILIAAYTVYYVICRIHEHRRIRRLGNYGPYLRTYAPWGLDCVVKNVIATTKHQNLALWRDGIFGRFNSWTVESRLLGVRTIFTADPANLKAILATQFTDYGKGKPFHREWSDFLGDSIFTTDGSQWHGSRQLIRPQFTRDRVSDLHCFEAHMQTLFRAIANGGPLQGEGQEVDMRSVNGKVTDISDLFFRYTLDVATEFLLGWDVKSLTTPRQEFAEAFNEVQHIQNIVARTGKLRHLIPKFRFWRGLRTVNHFINFYIERALRMSPDELASKSKDDHSYTFLHALAGFTRDRKVLRDQIIAVLLAGRDTTACTLSWALYELGRHPEAVVKLRAEILDTLGSERTPTYDDLKNMTYLKAVLNETLRLYPAVPFNVRLALKDTTLPRGGGPDGSEPLPVLKDSPVAYSTLVMQRRSDLYPPISDTFADPQIFSPERWSHWHPKPHEYIPFNAGPRICIGQQFALTEMGYVLCRMFQKYERVVSYMNEIDGGEPLLKADIVLSPGQGVRVAFWEAQA
ncbi:n-alkane-inducible cytochrome P450 [Fusarium albosuccineum]|uniref:N-alkane-inducible cytochrome P450 n=1 Tax=Fusarium albosuccineum TaxID=1237068 RepID=A0A8H4P5A8_9HYPO|nr:n-alkane-inducible cytochrome P450 [Fusarium albosuccineum]